MDYPLLLRFKVLAIAQQLSAEDAQGNLLWYVKQKAFALREAITIFADREQTMPVFRIDADRIIDFNARYHFTLLDTGAQLGAVRRRGARSLWRARYEVEGPGGTEVFAIHEANPWTKVADQLLGEIPVLGAFTGYFFHPAYLLERPSGELLMRLHKLPALWEGKFELEKLGDMAPEEERLALLAFMVTVLLEKRRG